MLTKLLLLVAATLGCASAKWRLSGADYGQVPGNVVFKTSGESVNILCSHDGKSESIQWTRELSGKVGKEDGILNIVANKNNGGVYTCSAVKHPDLGNVSIEIFVSDRPAVDYRLWEKNDTLELSCGEGTEEGYTYEWSLNGKPEDVDREKMHLEGNKLTITNPSSEDTGVFMCKEKDAEGGIRNTYFYKVHGVPYARLPPNSHPSKNVMQGESAELKCIVYGFPLPKVTWYKMSEEDKEEIDDDEERDIIDDMTLLSEINVTSRVYPQTYEGVPNASLVFTEAEFEDRAVYVCLADSVDGNGKAYKTILLRVKDRLAALWPFLGIVAEVVILVAIIFLYERRQAKRQSDDDDVTAEQKKGLTTGENVDVRQRAVKA